MSFKNLIFVFLLTVSSLLKAQVYTNPLLPLGPDPYSTYKDGYYYYTHTLQDRLELWRTKDLADLANAEHKVIFTPPANTMYSKELWAPEFQFINGKWYAYFAADDGKNENHRMYALENSNPDPFKGEWVFKGKVAAKTDKWAIDANVIDYHGKLYMAWSGWEGDEDGKQEIFIAKMSNPYTIEGERSKIGTPIYNWELYGNLMRNGTKINVQVNEGPQFLEHNGRLFIVFSASGCWTDNYSLGLMEFNGEGDILDPLSWKKHPKPIFQQSAENGVYGTGHNSFFKSPNGKEDWILYHANPQPGQGCGTDRSPRMQRLFWTPDGLPYIGLPVPEGVEMNIPSR